MSDMRHMRRLAWITVILAASASSGAIAQRTAPDAEAALAIAGWAETAWLVDQGLAVDAKLDTGADTSSLTAGGYETFSRGGRPWVRFTLQGGDGQSREIERPVLRSARIRRAGTGVVSRPVISLKLCVAGRTGEAEFTLADRSAMDYPMLIGRHFMAGRLMVDAGKTFAGTGECDAAGGKTTRRSR